MEDRRPEPGACSLPPALDDVDLLAAIDDEAGTEVQAHLRACPACAARAREFAELQGMLRRRLFRAFCPTSDELAAFQQGMLEGGRQHDVRQHTAGCPHCRREMELLDGLFTPQIPRR